MLLLLGSCCNGLSVHCTKTLLQHSWVQGYEWWLQTATTSKTAQPIDQSLKELSGETLPSIAVVLLSQTRLQVDNPKP